MPLKDTTKRKAYDRARFQSNPRRRAAHAARVRLKLYGLSATEFDDMWQRQGFMCAACGVPDPGSVKGWHVDHDHKTGHVRGILCSGCNVALGHLEDDPDRIRCLAEYVEKFRDH